jgi:hypothetical protein
MKSKIDSMRAGVASAAICSALVLCGCERPKPLLRPRADVSGEVISVQESMGWNTPIHTVIRDEEGYHVRVYGAYGQRGDKIKLRDALLYQ